MSNPNDVTGLVAEYRVLFDGIDGRQTSSLEDALVHEGEWTPEAAAHLLYLARAYGSFMLRSALAISLALGVEDGELGF